MSLKEEIQKLKEKLNMIEKLAQHPFLDHDYTHNPFKDAFSQTYVWVEKDED